MTLQGFFVAAPHDNGDAVMGHYYEVASGDPDRAQVWGYSDRVSYAVGDVLRLHGMALADVVRLTISRDGVVPLVVVETDIPGGFVATSADCSVSGCGWPVRFEMVVPEGWKSGLYRVKFAVEGHVSEHMFVVRAAVPANKVLFLLTTGTWAAYNDWGGSNHYQGLTGVGGAEFAPQVSLHRPWANGFVEWPKGAPRIPHASPLLTKPRYPHMEFARANGISKKYASSGWAAFERPFALWAGVQGLGLDYATQHDLHADAAALDGYEKVVIVGHDEYWTWEMRDHLDGWVARGGHLCRFAGNFFWQTRLSADLSVQTCFKSRAEAEDPVGDRTRLTSYWDNPAIGRPAVETMGLTGSAGVYAGWSRCAAHGSGGFTVYRPEHWALAGTGLGYGDVLGGAAKVFGYEVDGVEYVIENGLPRAADAGLAGRLEIIGLSPATTLARSTGIEDADEFIGDADAVDLALRVYGGASVGNVAKASRGNGAMAVYSLGLGSVFNAGSCEWVAGLIAGDRVVERVTRNVVGGG